jgi:cephalosporin-C deacetylase-like acetyl esterase
MEMSRSEFVQMSLVAGGLSLAAEGKSIDMSPKKFKKYQDKRRKELWGLLGDLPAEHAPKAKLRKKVKHDGFTLEHLELDLNGQEIAPAYLLIPDNIKEPAPGMMYIHWHGGNYDVGKDELLQGTRAMEAYAPVYAEKGIVALSIDSWCFGERMARPDNGGWGEGDQFKNMIWKGEVLYGMMMYDEYQALNYLCSRPEVDTDRLGSFGMSMGSTKSWWLGALDERIKCCVDLCCLTDYEALIEDNKLGGHGIYYYVPSLLKHFQTHEINELIVPRPRLSLNGRFDGLTPARGVERVRDHLYPLYEKYGKPEDCRIELFDCKHQELPEMRAIILEWLDKYLVNA